MVSEKGWSLTRGIFAVVTCKYWAGKYWSGMRVGLSKENHCTFCFVVGSVV